MPQFLKETQFHFDVLQKRLRELSFLNRGIKISLMEESSDREVSFQFEGGLLSYVEYLNQGKTVLNSPPIFIFAEQKKDGGQVLSQLECVLQWNDSYQENLHSYVNNINTVEGGTHLIA